MHWYIVYKCKPSRGTLCENLDRAGIAYFLPTQKVEYLEGDRMLVREESVLNNLIFIKTNENIVELSRNTDGLKYPYINHATDQPAVVSDQELQRFRRVLEARNLKADILADSIKRFAGSPRVRVKAGPFAGLEGYVFRIRNDRKLIISLDDMAIAISGIHHTLLEVIGGYDNTP